ncbi:venom allergen 2-like [Camponotus floridanus]|uniref:venom allergen 2-like n=1 Tax=Camponotus floridanus TaxID=104421 RepID=UPI000DC6CCF7|nr:venom allergen 2-like [Camponotus floridanus]
MKTIIFIACVLVIVRAGEAVTGKDFRNYLTECEKLLPKVPNLSKENNPVVVYCAYKRTGLISDNSPIDKDILDHNCEVLISNSANVERCKSVINMCVDKVLKENAANDILTQKINLITCGITNDLVGLVDS